MIYFDNAATSYPKPRSVEKGIRDSIKYYCGNPGRSGHFLSIRTAEKIYYTRELIAELLGGVEAERIIFTSGATFGLNMVISGIVKSGENYLISDLEHNSVIRPLAKYCQERGADYTVFKSDGNLLLNLNSCIKGNTTAVITTLCSNVTGTTLELEVLSKFAKEKKLRLIVDAAQAIGHYPIDLKKHHVDVLVAPGHKALFGPQGLGFVYICEGFDFEPLIFGGSGIDTFSLDMPKTLPEKFEAGTPPTPAIVGLSKGLEFLKSYGLGEVKSTLALLTDDLADALFASDMTVYGVNNGIGVFNYKDVSSFHLASILEKEGVLCRPGYHCSPIVHDRLGTMQQGAVRLSLSVFNTHKQIDKLYLILKNLQKVL